MEFDEAETGWVPMRKIISVLEGFAGKTSASTFDVDDEDGDGFFPSVEQPRKLSEDKDKAAQDLAEVETVQSEISPENDLDYFVSLIKSSLSRKNLSIVNFYN